MPENVTTAANGSARRTSHQIIQSFEAKALKKRSLTIRIADELSYFFGSINFLILNLFLFIAWILINLGYFEPLVFPFDPYPFVLLITAVSLEAIFLSVIVLISQNRQGYISSVRDELILQTNLIAERELTKALHLLNDLHKHHKVKRNSDPELEQMLKTLNTSYIERKLHEQIQGQPPKPIRHVVTGPIVQFAEKVEKKIEHATSKLDDEIVRIGNGKPQI